MTQILYSGPSKAGLGSASSASSWKNIGAAQRTERPLWNFCGASTFLGGCIVGYIAWWKTCDMRTICGVIGLLRIEVGGASLQEELEEWKRR